MASLQEACDAILQYLESRPEVDEGVMNDEEGRPLLLPMPPEEPLVLASIRCLGRSADSPIGRDFLVSFHLVCSETGSTLMLELY